MLCFFVCLFFNQALLFWSPEPVYKSSCALTLHAISHYSPDVLKSHAGVALPLAFLGMHQAAGPDEDKGESHDATLFGEVWQENVPGEPRLPLELGHSHLLTKSKPDTERIKNLKKKCILYFGQQGAAIFFSKRA